MRDTYYTLTAFNNIGHFEELEKYFDFIQNLILNEKNHIKPLYTISGEQVPDEKVLLLEGYMKNKPVRIGNNATYQVQNDVYGQILVSLLPLFIDKRLNYIDMHKSKFITEWLIDRIDEYMDIPDSGPWEFGTTNQFHCYTYLFHWAGSKAALKIGETIGKDEIMKKAKSLILRSEKYIEKCYDTDRAHNTFIICGFWYAEALAAVEMIDKAFGVIETLIKSANNLGLFSEDADENFGQWGNFPQAYSHVGLVNAVYRLSTKLDKPIFL